MRHTVTEEELADYVEGCRNNWQRFAVSSSAGSVKKLDFQIGQVAPLYRVTYRDRVVYVGALKETAVREYNAIWE